jgi:hypothetical protein
MFSFLSFVAGCGLAGSGVRSQGVDEVVDRLPVAGLELDEADADIARMLAEEFVAVAAALEVVDGSGRSVDGAEDFGEAGLFHD